jgi:hypothetical protein
MEPESPAQRDPAAHLAAHQWKKGQSGNPGGRPKGTSITAHLRELLEQEHHGKPIARLLAERLTKEGLQGKLGHVKEILDRTEGAAKQTVEVQGAAMGGGLIVLVPPEGASDAEIDRMGEEAQARVGPGQRILVGRCWLNMLSSALGNGHE